MQRLLAKEKTNKSLQQNTSLAFIAQTHARLVIAYTSVRHTLMKHVLWTKTVTHNRGASTNLHVKASLTSNLHTKTLLRLWETFTSRHVYVQSSLSERQCKPAVLCAALQ